MREKVVYIGGPYRGANSFVVERNIRKAEELAFKVAREGFVVICPHSMYRFFNGTLTDEYWIEATKELLARSDVLLVCKEFFRLEDGTPSSEGTAGEIEYATELHLPILYESEDWRHRLNTLFPPI